MATKKRSSGQIGGLLVFLGSLIYLYVVLGWAYGTALPSAWLQTAGFLAPFVIAVAIFSAVNLFFMSIGTMAGKMANMEDSKHAGMQWKFIMLGAITLFILAGPGVLFTYVLVGLILTYLGAIMGSM